MGASSVKPSSSPSPLGNHHGWVSSVYPVPDEVGSNVVLVSGAYDQSVRFWSRTAEHCGLNCCGGQGLANTVRTIAILPQQLEQQQGKGKATIACGESAFCGAKIEFVDLQTASVTKTLSGHRMAILDIKVVEWNNSYLLLSCGPDLPLANQENLRGVIRVYDLCDETKTPFNCEHDDRVLSLDVQQHCGLVAAGSYDKTILLLPELLQNGTDNHKIVLQGHTNYITGVQFHPVDKEKLFSCCYDGQIKMWDVNTQQLTETFTLSKDSINFHDLSINKTGAFIAVGSNIGSIFLCDTRTGTEVVTLQQAHTDMVLSVNFKPEQEHILYSGSKDKTVKMWDLKVV